MVSRAPKSQEDIELSGGRRKAGIASKRQNGTENVGGAGRHNSVKQPKGKRMATERQGESRVTRRTQSSQERKDGIEQSGEHSIGGRRAASTTLGSQCRAP